VDERGLVPDAAALLRHQDLEVVDHSLLHSIATTLIRLIWFLAPPRRTSARPSTRAVRLLLKWAFEESDVRRVALYTKGR
jgi:hypothetical protein